MNRIDDPRLFNTLVWILDVQILDVRCHRNGIGVRCCTDELQIQDQRLSVAKGEPKCGAGDGLALRVGQLSGDIPIGRQKRHRSETQQPDPYLEVHNFFSRAAKW